MRNEEVAEEGINMMPIQFTKDLPPMPFEPHVTSDVRNSISNLRGPMCSGLLTSGVQALIAHVNRCEPQT